MLQLWKIYIKPHFSYEWGLVLDQRVESIKPPPYSKWENLRIGSLKNLLALPKEFRTQTLETNYSEPNTQQK